MGTWEFLVIFRASQQTADVVGGLFKMAPEAKSISTVRNVTDILIRQTLAVDGASHGQIIGWWPQLTLTQYTALDGGKNFKAETHRTKGLPWPCAKFDLLERI